MAKEKLKKRKDKFPPTQCPECQSQNIHHNKDNDRVYCRDCGAIMTKS